MKKYLELYPSVTYNDVTYFTKSNEKLTSLCVLYRDVFFNHSQLDLFVHGNASCGKSSLIDSLKIFFIKNKILYYYINLSHLNNSPKLLAQTQKEMSDLSEEFVIVLDGYDE